MYHQIQPPFWCLPLLLLYTWMVGRPLQLDNVDQQLHIRQELLYAQQA